VHSEPCSQTKAEFIGNFSPDSERPPGLLADLQETRAKKPFLIRRKDNHEVIVGETVYEIKCSVGVRAVLSLQLHRRPSFPNQIFSKSEGI